MLGRFIEFGAGGVGRAAFARGSWRLLASLLATFLLLPGGAAHADSLSAGPGEAEASISTIAGDPAASGPATMLGQDPGALAIAPDGSSLYILNSFENGASSSPWSSIRELDAAAQETTVAGIGNLGFSGDGRPATEAELQANAGSLAVDDLGDLLVADTGNDRVRLIAAASCTSECPYGLPATTKGDIYTIAGDGTSGFSGDGGPAGEAELEYPGGLAVDHDGDLLISDGNNTNTGADRVRLVAAANCTSDCPYGLPATTKGDIYTIAGDGQGNASNHFSGDGGPATEAELDEPGPLAVDSEGDLLIDDRDNARVRLVAATSCTSECPYGLSAMTRGYIYTIAGGAETLDIREGVPATEDSMSIGDIAVDSAGDLLISEGETNEVRLVAAASCTSECPFGLPTMTGGDVYRVAGKEAYLENGVYVRSYHGFSGDGGPADEAQFKYLTGLAVDSAGDLLISDTGNDRVRLVAAENCASDCPYGLSSTTKGDIYTIAGNGTVAFSGDGGPATQAELSQPEGLAVDGDGDKLIADTDNNRVRLVAAESCASKCPYGLPSMIKGDIYTIAGDSSFIALGDGFSGDGGPATQAELDHPGGLAVDHNGDLLIADTDNNRVRLVAAESCASKCPYGLPSMANGDIYTIAGGDNVELGDGGPATRAELAGPTGLAMDHSGDVLITDSGPFEGRVRLVAAESCASECPYGLPTMTKGYIYTIAGDGSFIGPGDGFSGDGGPATEAELYSPTGLALDSAGDVLIADTGNDRVRLVAAESCASECPYGLPTMTKGYIYTIAGNNLPGPLGDGGPATNAWLYRPESLAVDNAGNLLVGDTANDRVRLVAAANCSSECPFGLPATTKGYIYTIAGDGSHGFSGDGGPATAAELEHPGGLVVDRGVGLLVSDTDNNRVRLIANRLVSGEPVFTAASPPETVPAGSSLEYTFAATGQPSPTYSLSEGAPSWLKIDPTSGKLTGAVPAGTTNFSYAVTATNSSGSRTAGPFFTAAAAPVPVEGTVEYINRQPAAGGVVDACLAEGGLCHSAVTSAGGAFRVSAIPGTQIVLTAYPPQSAAGEYAPGESGPTLVTAGGLQHAAVFLDSVTPPDVGLSGTLEPDTLNAFESSGASIRGCPYGLAAVTVTATNQLTGTFESNVQVLPELVSGSGVYSGALEPQYPLQGAASIHGSVTCPPQSALGPNLGPSEGGNAVMITGSGFTGATGVDFGQVAATTYTVLSDDLIEAVAPPGTGTVPVTVQGPGLPGGSAVVDEYTYVAVQSVQPANGPPEGGTSVTITGTGLASATAVRFGQTGAQFTQLSGTELRAVSPPGTGTQDITVETAYGGTTLVTPADQFTYGAGSGTSGAGSDASTRPATAAKRDAPPQAASAKIVPAVGEFLVSQSVLRFVYQYGPELLDKYDFGGKLNDAIHAALGHVTCQDAKALIADGVMLTISPLIDELVEAALPAVEASEVLTLSETGPLLVVAFAITPVALHWMAGQIAEFLVNAAVDASVDGCDTYDQFDDLEPLQPPQPNAYIDPSGTILDTNGNPVSGATATILRSETWLGPFAPVNTQAPGIRPAINPETTGADGVFHWDVYSGYYEVQATAPGCTAAGEPGQSAATIGPYPVPPPQVGLTISLSCADEPPPPTPAVGSLSESSGPAGGGTLVTVLGGGFTPSSRVLFGASPAQTTYLGPGALRAVSPPGTGPVDVVVQSAGGTSATSVADRFFYGSPPTIDTLSVYEGPSAGGTRITVHGTGFTAASAVGFGGLPGSSLVVRSDSELEVTSPPEPARTVDLQVVTPAGTSAEVAADRYTYLSPGPPPSCAAQSRSSLNASVVPACGEVEAVGHQPQTSAHITPPTASVARIISDATQSQRVWREGDKLARISSKRKQPVGTVYSFALNESAKVSFAFTQQALGRRVAGKCVARTGETHRRPSCKRAILRGTLSFAGHAATNRLAFQGAISHTDKLPPGDYKLAIAAINSAGQHSAPITLSFTIAPARSPR